MLLTDQQLRLRSGRPALARTYAHTLLFAVASPVRHSQTRRRAGNSPHAMALRSSRTTSGAQALLGAGTRAESSRSSRCIQTLACALPREFTGMFIARCMVTIPGGGTPPPPLLPPQRTRRLHLSAKAAPSVASKGQASPGAGEEQGRGGARGSARRERAPRGSAAVSPHGLVLERWCHLRAPAVVVAAVFVGCEARESELMRSGDIIDQR